MHQFLKPSIRTCNHPEAGLERIQVLVFLAIFAAAVVLVGPTLLKKNHAERDIRMKTLLRAFHSANEAYLRRHRTEGYAGAVENLVHNEEQVRYLGEDWLKGEKEGFSLVYKPAGTIPRASFSLSAQRSFLYPSAFCIDQEGVLHSNPVQGEPNAVPFTADEAGCHGGIEVV